MLCGAMPVGLWTCAIVVRRWVNSSLTSGSLFERHRRQQQRFKRGRKGKTPILKKYIKMGDYGASTQKPTWLYSRHEFVDDIDNHTTCIFNKDDSKGPMVLEFIKEDGTSIKRADSLRFWEPSKIM